MRLNVTVHTPTFQQLLAVSSALFLCSVYFVVKTGSELGQSRNHEKYQTHENQYAIRL